jgi:hypothetical protein
MPSLAEFRRPPVEGRLTDEDRQGESDPCEQGPRYNQGPVQAGPRRASLHNRVLGPTSDRVRPRGGHVALLVESDGYLAHPANPASNWDGNGRGADIPGSTAKRLREEYTVSPDGRYLLLNLTVEHRVYLSEPYQSTRAWERAGEDVAFEPFACDLESARRSSGNAVR